MKDRNGLWRREISLEAIAIGRSIQERLNLGKDNTYAEEGIYMRSYHERGWPHFHNRLDEKSKKSNVTSGLQGRILKSIT